MSGKSSGESSPPQGGSGLAYSSIVRAGTTFFGEELGRISQYFKYKYYFLFGNSTFRKLPYGNMTVTLFVIVTTNK